MVVLHNELVKFVNKQSQLFLLRAKEDKMIPAIRSKR